MHRRGFLLGLPFLLAACGAEEEWAPADVIAAKAYQHPGPPPLISTKKAYTVVKCSKKAHYI